MKRYEEMSREELVDEVFRLQAELAEERIRTGALEDALVKAGAQIFKQTEDGQLYGYGVKNTVVERRPYRHGHLTKEYRRNKRTGKMSGPYWQYRGVEDGKGINLYVGKTDSPEDAAEKKLRERGLVRDGDRSTR